MGPAPKPAATRQRRNRTTTRQTFRVIRGAEAKARKVPPLPKVKGVTWHPRVKAWWKDLWKSSDATDQLLEHEKSGGLLMLARLYQRFWEGKGDLDAAAQVRLNETRFGFDPLARARLQVEVDRGEAAKQRRLKRRNQRAKSAPDPRAAMREASSSKPARGNRRTKAS